MSSKKQSGLTLIELVIVISIIGGRAGIKGVRAVDHRRHLPRTGGAGEQGQGQRSATRRGRAGDFAQSAPRKAASEQSIDLGNARRKPGRGLCGRAASAQLGTEVAQQPLHGCRGGGESRGRRGGGGVRRGAEHELIFALLSLFVNENLCPPAGSSHFLPCVVGPADSLSAWIRLSKPGRDQDGLGERVRLKFQERRGFVPVGPRWRVGRSRRAGLLEEPNVVLQPGLAPRDSRACRRRAPRPLPAG